MHLRPMEWSDLSDVVNVHIQAFEILELSDFMHPYRHKYPLSYRHNILVGWKERFSRPGTYGLVSVTDPEDEPKGSWKGKHEIVGVALWERIGQDKTALTWRKNNRHLRARIERFLASLEAQLIDGLHLDQSTDIVHDRSMAEVKGHLNRYRGLSSYWSLKYLAVDPMFGRRGIATNMVKWGLDHADREGVPAALTASPMGESLYKKAGFLAVDYHNEPLGSGFRTEMVYDPRKEYVKELGEGVETLVKGRRVDVVWVENAKRAPSADPLPIFAVQ